MRAVLEGVAYSLQDTFTLFRELGIPVTAIRLGGGGARGALWRRIQAGIYGKAVEVLVAEEGGAFGCALMAGVGAGHWKNLDEACGQAIKVAERIEPDAADVAAYKAGYAQWRKLYPALRGLKKLRDLGTRGLKAREDEALERPIPREELISSFWGLFNSAGRTFPDARRPTCASPASSLFPS